MFPCSHDAHRRFIRPHALLCAFVAALAVGALLLCGPAAQARQPAGATTDRMFRSVTLVIAYGDDVEKRYGMLPWTQGMTALDAMKLAQAKPAPLGLVMEFVGEGERAFVKSIEGMANEGGKPGNRNWTYRINDRRGDRSCGVAPLEPGDTLLWQFLPMGEPKRD
jgi:hypothetical protein